MNCVTTVEYRRASAACATLPWIDSITKLELRSRPRASVRDASVDKGGPDGARERASPGLCFSARRARGTVWERGGGARSGRREQNCPAVSAVLPRAREEHQPPRPRRAELYLETQAAKKRKVLARARELVLRALLLHVARLLRQIRHRSEEFREIKYARAKLRVV